MKLEPTGIRLSATDLANHLACRHLTTLDRGALEGQWEPPHWLRPEADVLAERGLAHERAYLEHLERQGRTITRLDDERDGRSGLERTVAAMYQGADVIAQATLAEGRWLGRADVLVRVETKSGLGAYSYEALDTKLSRETKAGAILQLCLYSELIAAIQGSMPVHMHVVPRRPEFPLETYRVEDHLAYHRFVRRRLEAAADREGEAPTYPEPVPHCDVCRWWPRCDRRRRDDDHLSLVAGISRMQTRELESRALTTLEALAHEPVPIRWKPSRGAREGYGRVREQARVQFEGRAAQRMCFERLAPVAGRGLALLPAPSPGDLFLDFEGDPYVDDGGLEYLFGWVTADPNAGGASVYTRHWALDRVEEHRAFETLMDTILARWAADPGMHVYHFGAYEPATIKRLMGRYASREADVDRLLRAERFVDLHGVVRHSLRASVEEYSIKKLEPLYGFTRRQDLKGAGAAQRVVQCGLELGAVVATDDTHARIVEVYNCDDCESTRALRDWLETLRAQAIAEGAEIPRPLVVPGDPGEEIGRREKEARELAERLLAGVSEVAAERTPAEEGTWLLARLLDWHRREDKATWWDYFRLRELADDDLFDEDDGLAGLEFVERVPGAGRTPVDRYRFPVQETTIRAGKKLHVPLPDAQRLGDVAAIDLVGRTIDIRKPGALADVHPSSCFMHDQVPTDVQAGALLRLGSWVATNGVNAPGAYRAARDLLLGREPRIIGHAGGALQAPDERGVDAACRLVLGLDHSTLALQGPPGSGKTYTGARMIADLVRAGRRVGVCAVSHKVIANLLRGVLDAAEGDPRITCMRKVSDKSDAVEGAAGIVEVTDNARARDAIRSRSAAVVGGTPWLWAREDFFEAVDVLFVDEAGQMSLANVLAIAQSARSLVLLGDPRQLEQPTKGHHPDGTAVSALQHVLGTAQTIAADRGLFLGETWRLAPAICELTSELFYERRLTARPGLERQALIGDVPWAGAGLWYVPVRHDANQSASPQEVDAVAELVRRILGEGTRWRDRDGAEYALELDDVLVIAPYNAQVADLRARLPDGARVGTVDKFQGQEAPVVIYSMTTSTPEDAPRGMEFLYSPNRFNVATSRAKCACFVVGSPRLFEPDCQSPKQIKLANAFCRYLEKAKELRLTVGPAAV